MLYSIGKIPLKLSESHSETGSRGRSGESPAGVPKVKGESRISQAKGQSRYIFARFAGNFMLFFLRAALRLLFFCFNKRKGEKMETFQKIVDTINTYLSDYILLILLVGMGIFFSIRTRFVQLRCFGEGMRAVFGKGGRKKTGGVNRFQALTTAIAAQVGTGNIVGACGAILVGGPGAIFWMWVIAFFGMSTIYAEAVLAQKTRKVDKEGSILGGPVYYIKAAFKGSFGKILAGFFAIATILALGFMGAMVQSNSIGSTMNAAFGIPSWIMGLIVAAIAGIILFGGVKRIVSVNEKLVPIMAVLYLIGSLVVLAINITGLPAALGLIFKYAFTPSAALGGGFGAIFMAMTQGAKRGLFSNEAGMGSTPHAHALADVDEPHEQGVSAMIGVFIDTFIVLTMTALVVITVLYTRGGALADFVATGDITLGGVALDKTTMAQEAFAQSFGNASVGNVFVAICLFFFAFSTIIGWNYFGKVNIEYLFGKKAVPIYTAASLVFIVLGSFLGNDLVWGLTDMFNQLMVIPNAIALFALSGMVAASVKKRNKSDIGLKNGDVASKSNR